MLYLETHFELSDLAYEADSVIRRFSLLVHSHLFMRYYVIVLRLSHLCPHRPCVQWLACDGSTCTETLRWFHISMQIVAVADSPSQPGSIAAVLIFINFEAQQDSCLIQ